MTSRLILLGTSGGAGTFAVEGQGDATRFGIASALVVDGAIYVVDAGQGVARQLTRALLPAVPPSRTLAGLRAVFLTHLHSDHTMDLVDLVLCGQTQSWPHHTVPVHGPGTRPGSDVPGTQAMVRRLLHAYEADAADRSSHTGSRHRATMVAGHDIPLPDGVARPADVVQPWVVYRDDRVTVSTTLVDHGSMAPAHAYRFDTADGAVVFSGDTTPCPTLIDLARGADVLVHEAADPSFGQWQYGPGPLTDEQRAVVAAVMAKHTPTDKVGPVAQAAGVDILVLSHLVPGSAPRNVWEAAAAGFSGRFVIGEDLMEIPLPPR